jgi:uncharacterized damage-inducible protein DinB
MTGEQARAVATAMTELWRGEFPATVRVLESVTDDGRDYRPVAKSRSAWELVTHIATSDLWFISSIVQGSFQWDPEAAQRAEAQFHSVADVVAFYRSAFPQALDKLAAISDEQLAEEIDFFGMMKMSRATWIGFACNHCVHHRGQLSAYLRPLGSRVPDIYGPSGDAEQVPVSA